MSALVQALKTQPNEVHPWSKFEGYYTRFTLPSGASLVLVICSVPRAPPGNNHNVTIIHVPAHDGHIFQEEIRPDALPMRPGSGSVPWSVGDAAGPALVSALGGSGHQVYSVTSASGIEFKAESLTRVPWSTSGPDTPEGWFKWLPFPLHWHVHSLASRVRYTLKLPPSAGLHAGDSSGTAFAHQEKNWANGFPSAHHWIQGRKNESSICLAGGEILGMEAYLVGYRNKGKGLELDFRPPFALKALGLSPFMAYERDWDARAVRLSVSGLFYRVDVEARAPKGSFFTFSAPYEGGFQSNWMAQSLRAVVDVRVLKRRWWGGWEVLIKESFKDAGLEFGGVYYPMRGSDQILQ